MTKWTSNKRSWQWVSLLCYVGILFWMGSTFLHRKSPDLFYILVIVVTAALIVVLRLLERRQH